MDAILFIMTLTSTIVIAFNLFAVEMNAISLETIVAFFDLFVTLSLSFAYCYLSDWITADLLEIGDIFYNSPWYRLLSTRKQRLLVLPIQRAHRLVRLRSLGLFDCSAAVFLSVIIYYRCWKECVRHYLILFPFSDNPDRCFIFCYDS